jgi:hypothetical protein
MCTVTWATAAVYQLQRSLLHSIMAVMLCAAAHASLQVTNCCLLGCAFFFIYQATAVLCRAEISNSAHILLQA